MRQKKHAREIKQEPFGFLGNASIKKQFYIIYIIAIILPITIIGSFLLINTSNLLTNYYRDLLESDNLRVRTILFEITTQVFNISEEVSFDTGVQDILTKSFSTNREQIAYVNETVSSIDNYMYNYPEIDRIEIYSDNPNLYTYKQYSPVTEEIEATAWYQKAISQSSVFWTQMDSIDRYGNDYWNLCLVRKIPLINSDYHAVLVIRVSDNYLKTRMNSQEYLIFASVDDGVIFYASEHADYGKKQFVDINYDDDYFEYVGSRNMNGKHALVNLSTLHLYQSDSKIYICNVNDKYYEGVLRIIQICMAIIALAIIIPGLLIHFFTEYFSNRVLTLRKVMHQASNEDYDFQGIVRGNDEISEAFADLEIMVQRIKEKDAQMYEAQINEKELINEQQKMEFKMLASQINPHFLYNTLETIRMKAYTAGDKEVATAIKLLGKSMRYVLENMGTAFTALQNELNHIETYMTIQKLRFGEKFNYQIDIAENIDAQHCKILPLLLQPVVENAILHGLEEKESGGLIRIVVDQVKKGDGSSCIEITISDNGCGMDEETLQKLRADIETKNPEKKESIGLYNINQRVKLCYGERYGMTIMSVLGEGTSITITLPE